MPQIDIVIIIILMIFRSFAIGIGFSESDEFQGRDSCGSGECAEEV